MVYTSRAFVVWQVVVVAAVMLFATSSSRAATINVTSTSGGTGGSNCTIRDAITAANNDTATGGCTAGSGADTIELPAEATITLTVVDNNGIGGDNGLPPITSDLTINGNGTTIERSSVGGTPSFRIVYIDGGSQITLNALTISGGEGVFDGGGIWCVLEEDGLLTINDSTISGNSAQHEGGGLYLGVLSLTAVLTNNTVSGNSGGGLYVEESGDIYLRNCTVTGNMGGGVKTIEGILTLTNTIVSGNSPADCTNLSLGQTINNGFNLVEDGSCGFPANGDPSVGPLTNNGGPTQTHALLEGSIAIDAGDCSGGSVTTDQRGIPRPQRGGCDIGAYELENAIPTVSEWGLVVMALFVGSGGTVILSMRRHGQAFAA